MKRVVAVLTVAVLLVFLRVPSEAGEKRAEIRVISAERPVFGPNVVFFDNFKRFLEEAFDGEQREVVLAIAAEWEIFALEYVIPGRIIPEIIISAVSKKRGEMSILRLPPSAQSDPIAAARFAVEETIRALLEQSKKGRRGK